MPRTVTSVSGKKELFRQVFDTEETSTSLDELMLDKRRLVILGPAGVGKSMELLYRAQQWRSSNDTRRSIFLRLNNYTGENIRDILPKDWQNVPPGDLYIFLDGLDEIQPSDFRLAVKRITDFQASHPLVGIVISCRSNFYDLPTDGFSGTLPDFDIFDLKDISYHTITAFAVDKYGIDGQSFLSEVHQNGFSDLVQRPFFLRVLLDHFQEYSVLKISRSVIMENALLNEYDFNREHFNSTISVLKKAQTFRMLEKIAFVMEIRAKNFLTDDDLSLIFPLNTDYEQCRFLPAFARNDIDGHWMFVHNNYHEYLASRILSRMSLDMLLELMSSDLAGKKKVKRNWVNTLSFLISIGDRTLVDPLLKWLTEHDKEVIIRFEPGRVRQGDREDIFRKIFEQFQSTGIWLHSNKFSAKDLAVFGQSTASLDYLLKQLGDPSSDTNNLRNALLVIRHFDLDQFATQKKAVYSSLIALLDRAEVDAEDIYSIMNTVYMMRLNDLDTVRYLVKRYGHRQNQYIRAGLYHLIQFSAKPDEFIQVYIEGMDKDRLYSSHDREPLNLMDESSALKNGLLSLSEASSVNTLIQLFTNRKYKPLLYQKDYADILKNTVRLAQEKYRASTDLYESLLALYHKETSRSRSDYIVPVLNYFLTTGRQYMAFKDTWEISTLPEYAKTFAIAHLATTAIIKRYLVEMEAKSGKEDFEKLQAIIFFSRAIDKDTDPMLNLIEATYQQLFNTALSRPRRMNYNAIFTEREQKAFDILFEPDQLIGEVNRVYDVLAKEDLNWDMLYEAPSDFEMSAENRFNLSALTVIGHLMHGTESVNRHDVEAWLHQQDQQLDFRVDHLQSDLSGHQHLQVTDQQKDFIRQWLMANPHDQSKTWFFLNRLKLILPPEQILELTTCPYLAYGSDDHSTGTIDKLEQFVDRRLIRERVDHNLKTRKLSMQAWLMNADYALRHHLKSTFPYIIDRLDERSHSDYYLDDVLKHWFSRTQDSERLKVFAASANSHYLRWTAVTILEDAGNESAFLMHLMTKIMNNEQEEPDQRIYAANHLTKFNDIKGLYFLENHIINSSGEEINYRVTLGSVGALRDTNAIEPLIRILKFAKLNKLDKDPFNNLESSVLTGLHHIATGSVDAFKKVRTALKAFINDHISVFPQLKYLQKNIDHMEEELRKHLDENIRLDAALAEFERFNR